MPPIVSCSIHIKESHIKISFEIVLSPFLFDFVLGVEDDLIVFDGGGEEGESVLFVVVVHHEEAMLHAHRQSVFFLDCHGLLLLHRFGLTVFPLFSVDAHEKMVHLLLFFSSILHSL